MTGGNKANKIDLMAVVNFLTGPKWEEVTLFNNIKTSRTSLFWIMIRYVFFSFLFNFLPWIMEGKFIFFSSLFFCFSFLYFCNFFFTLLFKSVWKFLYPVWDVRIISFKSSNLTIYMYIFIFYNKLKFLWPF